MVHGATDAATGEVVAVELVEVLPLLAQPLEIAALLRQLTNVGELDTVGVGSGSELLNEFGLCLCELLLDLCAGRGCAEHEAHKELGIS